MAGEDFLGELADLGAEGGGTLTLPSTDFPAGMASEFGMGPSLEALSVAGGDLGGDRGGGIADLAARLFGTPGVPKDGRTEGILGSGGILNTLTGALGLGTTGLGIANAIASMNRGRQQQQMLQRGQNLAFSAAQPAVAFGTQQVNQAEAGQLSPAMEADIAQRVQRAKADARARLAHLGISDSTMIEAEMRRIDQEALALKAQLLNQEGQLGINALNVGAGQGLNAGSVGANQEALIAQILASANQQLATMGARG